LRSSNSARGYGHYGENKARAWEEIERSWDVPGGVTAIVNAGSPRAALGSPSPARTHRIGNVPNGKIEKVLGLTLSTRDRDDEPTSAWLDCGTQQGSMRHLDITDALQLFG